jgi:hypothetical protein
VIGLVLLWTVLEVLVRFGRLVARVCPEVDSRRPFVAWSNAVAPVVLIGKTAARIPNHARFKFFQVVDQRFADAVVVGDLRFLTDPDAVVDNAAEVLDEVTVDVGRYRSDRWM